MSLVDCDGVLPTDEPAGEMERCVDCQGPVWVREGEFVLCKRGVLCVACAPVEVAA